MGAAYGRAIMYFLQYNIKVEKENNHILSLDTMYEFIDRKHWVMNYPYGSYNSAILDYIKSQGCVLV